MFERFCSSWGWGRWESGKTRGFSREGRTADTATGTWARTHGGHARESLEVRHAGLDVLVLGIFEIVAVVVCVLGDDVGLSALDRGGGGGGGGDPSCPQLALGDVLLEGGDVLGIRNGEVSHDILDGAVDGNAGDTRVDLDVPLDVDSCVVGQGGFRSDVGLGW